MQAAVGVPTRSAYGEVLVELGEANPNIVVLDADLGKSTMTARFARRFPERYFDVGIAEQDLFATAAGLASCGKVVFASTFAMFAMRAWEQIRNTVAYGGYDVKIVATHGGVTVGEDGSCHQALEDIALMRAMPGMRVIVPADATETRDAIRCVAAQPGPFYVRLGRAPAPVVFGGDGSGFTLGRARLLRDGSDVAIMACGVMTAAALEAADELSSRGVDARVYNVSTVKPLDGEAVRGAAGCGAVVAAEEHTVIGGLGSAVAEAVCQVRPVPVVRVGIRDRFGQSGKAEELLAEYGLTSSDIVRAAERAMSLGRG